ncbi:TRAP transporter small permease [Saccharospirillum salsuginis]|uniref:TRAP transporter small permease protein n=1 Tax=Saccharospirillum salsuginis TaxID=418750 RepID=A0A918NJD0_9GAMM|nr:TRAP transporter small permease [Saccharospirillum salsuginis]GGX72102.1 hypothetical protein GCM10007392_44390 [Saccharospirillum salsuginis]
MNWLFKLTDRTTAGLALLGTLGVAAMMVHVTLDVIARTLWSVSIPATLEIVTRYYMITLALLPLGWVEWKRQMITVELFTGLFGQQGVKIIDALVAILSAVVYIAFTQATWIKAVEQYELGAYVMSLNFPMPVWPTYFVLPLAFALATLVSVVRIPQLFITPPKTDS